MSKGKGGRGGRGGGGTRGGGQAKGRNRGRQNLIDPTLDTEMFGVTQRNRQSGQTKQVQNKPRGDQTELKQGRRGQVDKVAQDTPRSRQSIFPDTSQALQPSDRANSSIPSTTLRNPFVTTNGPRNPFATSNDPGNPFVTINGTRSRQTTVLSCVSALSSKVGRGSHCFKCNRTNRKLRQALFDLLERALKDGKNLIDEWAWKAGVSPDHMDCERTKTHIIPQGLQSGNEPSHGFEACHTNILSSQTPQAPGLLQPSAGTYQPSLSRPQHTLNPFFAVRPSVFENQPPHVSTPQVPSTRPWTMAHASSAAGQYAGDVGHRDQASQSQTQQNPYQQQRRDCHTKNPFQVATGNSCNSPGQHQHQFQDQRQPPPASAQSVEQALVSSCIPDPVIQETHGGYPLLSVPQMVSVQVPQAQQHLPSSNLTRPFAAFTTIATTDHGEDQIIPNVSQSRGNVLRTPPPSSDMSIQSMLNKEACPEVGPPCETVYQSAVDRRPEGSGPVPGSDQRQPPQLVYPEQRQDMTPKYCCEVIPNHAPQ